MPVALVVDDDHTFCAVLTRFLERAGLQTQTAHSLAAGKQCLQSQKFDIALLDYRLPDGTGLQLLEAAKALHQDMPVVMMTSFSDVRTAVKSMQMGAYEYITKPINHEELLLIVQQGLQQHGPAATAPHNSTGQYVTGESAAAQKLQQQIGLVADTALSVIVQGESGTGKEQVARRIHALSSRATGPFVAVDCGTLSAELAGSELFGHVKGAFTGAVMHKNGKLLEAHGGTLFLDEIGNLPYEVQVKLLRVLQERSFAPLGSNKERTTDIRIIAATNDNLKQMAREGRFREDLYHRLNEFLIEVPALKDRTDDFEAFVAFFLADANALLHKKVDRIDADTMALLRRYDWPGNIRELKNIIRRMVLLTPGTLATADSLPDDMLDELSLPTAPAPAHAGPDLKHMQENIEKSLIASTLEQVKYNKAKAARLLHIDRSTLYAKMKKYGLEM